MACYLNITSDPSGANVFIDGKKIGTTKVSNYLIQPGTYNIILEKPGYVYTQYLNYRILTTDLVKHLDVKGKAPAAELGSIRFKSSPSEAEIYLDNNYMGKTSKTISSLAAGKYYYRLELDGYETKSGSYTLDEGENATIDKTLTKILVAPPYIPPIVPPVIPPEVPEATWWEKLLAKIVLANPIFKFINSEFFRSDFKELTGEDLTEANWVNWTDYILNYITPINVFNKLIYGKNLAGEAEEFGTAEDYIDLAFLFIVAIPGEAVAKVGAKVAEKAGIEGLSKLAGRLAEKKIAPEVIEELISKGAADAVFNEIRKAPLKFAEVIPKLSDEFRAILISGLKKSADPTAYRLASAALETAAKSEGLTAVQKVLGILPGTTIGKKLFITFTSLVGAAATYVGLAQFLAWTGKEAIKEAISFSGLYLAIDTRNWELAKENLPLLRDAIDAYKKATALARTIPFIGDIWEKAIEAAEVEYDNYERLIEAGLAEEEIEPEEEKWERIRLEQEAREEAGRIEEAEYYAKLQEEADKRKAAARVEEAEYFEKIRIEAEERAAARKIEEAEYWANVQEQARIAEEEKQILAEEYWARVEEEQRLKREEEEKYWAAKLAGPKKATITITSEPTGADVYIDGEFTWVTTPYTALLTLGDHVFRVQKEGYYPYEITAEVEEGDVAEIPFTLELIPVEEIPEEPYIPQKTYYPTYIPAEPYVPDYIQTPISEIPYPNYSNLYPEEIAPVYYEAPAPVPEKELLINIETTDVNPWEGRIYSIAFQDLSNPEALPNVLVSDNEEELINQFLELFNYFNPEKLIGFKLTFDHRFIFAKMMLYRIQNEAFKNIEMHDVKQIMDQVQEAFVYFPSKTGTLDDWGKMLLGKGKYGSQELMLRKYLAGDFEYVKAFQERQLEITNGLYQLSRFSGSESISAPVSSIPGAVSTETLPVTSITSQTQSQKQCSNCLAYNPSDSKVCIVCGQEF